MAASYEFAISLAEMRLRQTARLLQSVLDESGSDGEAVATALGAVLDAHTTVRSISPIR